MDSEQLVDIDGGMKPIVVFSALFGFYHFRWGPLIRSENKKRLTIVYSLLVVIFCWVNFTFSCIMISAKKAQFDYAFTVAISALCWDCQIAVNSMIIFYACWQKTKMPNLMKQWQRKNLTRCSELRKDTNISNLICFVAFGVTLTIFAIWQSMSIKTVLRDNLWETEYPFLPSTKAFAAFYSFKGIMMFYSVCCTFVPISLLNASATKANLTMKTIMDRLRKDIGNGDIVREGCIEDHRAEYEAWAKDVAIINDIFNVFFAWNFLTGIPMACFLLYMIYFTFSPYLVVLAFSYVFSLAMITTPAAQIADQVSLHILLL